MTMKNRQEVSKKIARTLLAMSLVYAGGMFASCEKAMAWWDNPVITKSLTYGSELNDNFNIISSDFAGKNEGLLVNCNLVNSIPDITGDINIETPPDSQLDTVRALQVHNYQSTGTINIKGNLKLQAQNNYALFYDTAGTASNSTLSVNPDGGKTVQILGDVGVTIDADGNILSKLELKLDNAASYLAGDFTQEIQRSSGNTEIAFKLHNGATWYPKNDTYAVGTSDKKTLTLDLEGGIIDLYHSQPGVARSSGSARTFTLSNITDGVSGTNGTTFRIGSDVQGINNGGTGTADKIVLNGDASYSGNGKYFIQIVAAPSITSSAPVLDVADKQIVVAQVNDTIKNNGIAIEGSKYVDMDMDAGLTLADVTPELEYDATADSNNGGYIIKKITADNIRSVNGSGEKGSALTLAEIGAATALNVASAWRADNNDLLRRMGDLRTSGDEAGVWVRMYGGTNQVRTGQQTDMDYKAVQGGYDYQSKLKNGRLFTGFTVSHLDGDVSGSHTDGDVNSTMFGLYGSYVGDKGHFADLIVKYGRINSDFTTIKGTNRYGSDYGSNGFSITTEYGYRQNLKDNFYIEPQAELTYSRIGGSDYTMSLNDSDGAEVSNDAFNSLIGRVGFTVGRQQEQSNVYAKLSLAREFKGEVATSASYGDVTRSYESGGSDTWFEYGIGFNAKMSQGTNLYGEIEKTTGSVIRTKWRANMGLRYSF